MATSKVSVGNSLSQAKNLYVNGSANSAFTTSATTANTASSSLYYNNLASTVSTPLSYAIGCYDADSAYDIMALNMLSRYLQEDELTDLLNKIIARSELIDEDKTTITAILSKLIKLRHFSEDFLMTFYSYLKKSDIYVLHTSDIVSGQYSQLALLLMNDETKK